MSARLYGAYFLLMSFTRLSGLRSDVMRSVPLGTVSLLIGCRPYHAQDSTPFARVSSTQMVTSTCLGSYRAMFCSSSSFVSATIAKSLAGIPLRCGLSPYRPNAMPQRSDFRADNTMPRTMRAARFFWKMPRYTTSQIRADMGRLLQQWSTGRTARYPFRLKWSRNNAYGRSLACEARARPNRVTACQGSRLLVMESQISSWFPYRVRHHATEILVDRQIVSELGVKRRNEDGAFARHHGTVAVSRERLNRCAELANARRADEHHLQWVRRGAQVGDALRGKRLALAPVRVALDGHIDEAERELAWTLDVAREQNQSGARAEDRLACPVELLQRGDEAPLVHELEQRRRFSPRNDQTVESLELFGLAHLP